MYRFQKLPVKTVLNIKSHKSSFNEFYILWILNAEEADSDFF